VKFPCGQGLAIQPGPSVYSLVGYATLARMKMLNRGTWEILNAPFVDDFLEINSRFLLNLKRYDP
jgi:hypothetical protein